MPTEAPEPDYFTGSALSRSGLVSVETTESGLPTAVKVDRTELRRNPDELANEILRLCKQSANRARLARRAALVEAGVDRGVLRHLGLPTAAEVAKAELLEEAQYDYEPQSWLGT